MTGVTPATTACPGLEPHGATWSGKRTASGSMGSGFWAGMGGAGAPGQGEAAVEDGQGSCLAWLEAPWTPWTGNHPIWPRGPLVLLRVPGCCAHRASGHRPTTFRVRSWTQTLHVGQGRGAERHGILWGSGDNTVSLWVSVSKLPSLLVGGFQCGALSPRCAEGGRAGSRPGGLATRPWGRAQEGVWCSCETGPGLCLLVSG